MSKKIIAITLLFVVVFTSVFTACGKKDDDETRVYISPDEYDFVTDEDGSRVYNTNGEFLVYATEEKGKRVTNEAGEEQTLARPFEPIEDKKNDMYENYSYSIVLPKGWTATNTVGTFENTKNSQRASIRLINKTYNDYRDSVYESYKSMKGTEGISVTWQDDVKLTAECTKTFKFTLTTAEGTNVMYVFLNSGNLYKILFETTDSANAIKDSEEICKAIAYKPYIANLDVASENLATEKGLEPTTEATTAEESTTAAKVEASETDVSTTAQ